MIRSMRRKGLRSSPALIVALVALVAALAGNAVAAESPAKPISKNKVKQITIKQINKAAPELSVANATTADSATTAETAGSADNVLWAVVNNGGGPNDAAVARAGQPGTTVTEVGGIGPVNVDFGRVVTDCAWLATNGAVANATPEQAVISTEGVAANPEAVQVRLRDGNVGGLLSQAFHLEVIC